MSRSYRNIKDIGCPKIGKKKKVFVAMSGGVDSSVAAALLKKQGYDVYGIHIKMWTPNQSLRDETGQGDSLGSVCEQQYRDRIDAMRAASHLDIPFQTWDFTEAYKKEVVNYMVREYAAGRTPNPDVMCNREIKFGLFLKKAREMRADYVATGHYVRLVSRYISDGTGVRPVQRGTAPMSHPEIFTSRKPSISGFRNCRTKHIEKLAPFFSLLAAKDKNKDQSYFLWTLAQEQLKHCLFPIGEYTKPEVRKLAKEFGLPNAEKKDSQGICFIGQVNLKDFLKKYIPEKKGLVLDTSGRIVGEHDGAHFYTIGQRHIGVANRRPCYVAEKDVKENALLVAEENDSALYKEEAGLTNVNFINMKTFDVLRSSRNMRTPDVQKLKSQYSGHRESQNWTSDVQKFEIPVLARVRYRQPLFPAILKINRRSSVVSCKLKFNHPIKFVAPGQSAAFYSKKGELLGGGTIA